MQQRPIWQQIILGNIAWFLLSLVLAVLVWLTAVSQSNPFEERRMVGIPLRVNLPPGLVVTNESNLPQVVSVQLVGQRSEVSVLTSEDLIVTADLSGFGPGTHTVQLQGSAARGVNVSTIIPVQVTVDLEVVASQLVEVRPRVINEPPPDTEAGNPQFDVLQVEVSGPQSRVQQVAAAEVSIDLRNQRSDYEDDVRPIPVDADGNTVTGVSVAPQVVHVIVPIAQSETVREVNVSPRTIGELPEGYFLTQLDYNPKTIYMSVPSGALTDVPQTLFTIPIDITGRTGDFQETVPLDLAGLDLIPISESSITVTVFIEAQTATRQLDNVTIEQIGGSDDFRYSLEPSAVALIITAPQPILERLTRDAVRVTADVSGLGASGTYSIPPAASLTEPGIDASITILPAQIDVVVAPIDPAQDVTSEPN